MLFRYLDNNSDTKIKLFKIKDDYTLSLSHDFLDNIEKFKELNFHKDVLLNDNYFLFVNKELDDNLDIFIFKNLGNEWEELSNLKIDLGIQVKDARSLLIDYFENFIIVNYYDSSNSKINNLVYQYNDKQWELKKQITNEILITGPLSFWDRVSYCLRGGILDISILIDENLNDTLKVKNISIFDYLN